MPESKEVHKNPKGWEWVKGTAKLTRVPGQRWNNEQQNKYLQQSRGNVLPLIQPDEKGTSPLVFFPKSHKSVSSQENHQTNTN